MLHSPAIQIRHFLSVVNPRPSYRNVLSRHFFAKFPKALPYLDQNPQVLVIFLSSQHFCAGIDISTLENITSKTGSNNVEDRGCSAGRLRREIMYLQDAITSIELCRKPVIAAVRGVCISGGVDVIATCDVRYCIEDVLFSVKEIHLAIVADFGTLQSTSNVGYANVMELALTWRRYIGVEANALVLELPPSLLLLLLAQKQGLDYVATWKSAMLISDDLKEAIAAHIQKRKPLFANF